MAKQGLPCWLCILFVLLARASLSVSSRLRHPQDGCEEDRGHVHDAFLSVGSLHKDPQDSSGVDKLVDSLEPGTSGSLPFVIPFSNSSQTTVGPHAHRQNYTKQVAEAARVPGASMNLTLATRAPTTVPPMGAFASIWAATNSSARAELAGRGTGMFAQMSSNTTLCHSETTNPRG